LTFVPFTEIRHAGGLRAVEEQRAAMIPVESGRLFAEPPASTKLRRSASRTVRLFGRRKSMRSQIVSLVAVASLAAASGVQAEDLVVGDGMKVSFEYTLSADKAVVDTNVGQEPVAYVHGQKQIIPGLEKAFTGMKAGESKHVDIAAKDAYGPYDDKARVTVQKDKVPPDTKAGTMLSSPDGRPVKVVEVKDEGVVLDLNHPLAGKDLAFDVKVVKVENAPAAANPPAEAPAGEEKK
jgi:FKBP-type peptidyl-prolyl cis-trans isomerase 2